MDLCPLSIWPPIPPNPHYMHAWIKFMGLEPNMTAPPLTGGREQAGVYPAELLKAQYKCFITQMLPFKVMLILGFERVH